MNIHSPSLPIRLIPRFKSITCTYISIQIVVVVLNDVAGVDRDRIQGLGAENKSDRDSAIKNYIFHLQKKHRTYAPETKKWVRSRVLI